MHLLLATDAVLLAKAIYSNSNVTHMIKLNHVSESFFHPPEEETTTHKEH